MQAEPSGYMLAGPPTNTLDVGLDHSGQHPANVDSHHWFLETLLRHKRADGIQRDDKPRWLVLCTMARCAKYASAMQLSRRQRVLGPLLLQWAKTVNLPFCGLGLGHTNCLHLGRFRMHVHWHLAGHPTPCEAQEAVADRSSAWLDRTPFGCKIPFALWFVEQAHLPHFFGLAEAWVQVWKSQTRCTWLEAACQRDHGCGTKALDDSSWCSLKGDP